MRLGVHLVNFTLPGGPESIGPTLAATGAAVEEAGVDNVSFMDHYLQLDFLAGASDPMLEGYTALGFLAAHTSTVELQLLMTGVTYRHPGLLAKIVSTLDVVSGGRAALGIGAAWYEREHRALGVPFPPLGERFERLLNSPQPLRKPHPPIMVGGGGEKKTLRLVATYADACNVFAGRGAGPDEVAHKLAVLREWCEREERAYDEIRKTVLYNGLVGPGRAGGGEFVEEMRALADVGVDEVHVMPLQGDPAAFVRSLGEHVVPALSRL